MGSSNRSGTAAMSTTSRSRWRRILASSAVASITRARVRCATSSRLTCCSCSASPPWRRRLTSTRIRCATRKSKFSSQSTRSMSRKTSSAASTARAGWAASRFRATGRSSTSRPPRPRRPSSQSASRSTTGAGPKRPFICAPASACRAAPPRLQSSSRTRRTYRSPRRPWRN